MAKIVWQYPVVRKLLMPQLRKCRDKGVRVKAEFLLYGLKLGDVALAAKRLGLGRSSYYKWKRRLIDAGGKLKGLAEKSRRPRRSPKKMSIWLESKIRFLGRRKGFGALMVQQLLLRDGEPKVAVSVIQHVLNDRKPPVKKKRAPKLKKHRKRYELPIPGQRLQVDVKYCPVLIAGKRAYVYVAVDECTRWRFAWAYYELNERWTVDFLQRLQAACPFPIHVIQTDNGFEFTFKLHPHSAREHAMDRWCRQHKIGHRLIPPGVKELNGKVERSHRIDADYFYGRAPTTSLEALNRALQQWLSYYNEARPHGGIKFMTPVEKLAERLLALGQQPAVGDLEPMAQQFLRESPMLQTQEGRQLLRLELELRQYNLDIAS